MKKFINERLNRELKFGTRSHTALNHTFALPYVPEQSVKLTISKEDLYEADDEIPMEVCARVIICNDPVIELNYHAKLDSVDVGLDNVAIMYSILDEIEI